MNERKCLDMIWANEAGVSVYVYEAEYSRREIEIHGVVNDHETVLARATIEKHNLRRVMVAFTPPIADFVEKYNISDEDWAELAQKKPPIKSAAPSPEPQQCVKCGHYGNNGYCITTDERCGCQCEFSVKECAWTYDPDGYWATSCGDQFCITEGSPAENRMRYCHYCSGRIITDMGVGVVDSGK